MTEEMSKLLYIEDDEALAVITKSRLERESYSVDTAHSAEEGIDKALNGSYDALIIDYQLPDSIGPEIIKTLKSKGKSLPCIIITAEGDEDLAADALNEGAQDYIVKDMYMNYMKLMPHILRKLIESNSLAKLNEQMQKNVKEQENSLKLLSESTNTMMFKVGSGEVISYVSDNTAKILGYTPGKMIAKNLYKYIHPDDIEVPKDNTNESAKPNHSSDEEDRNIVRMKKSDGSYSWMEWTKFEADDNEIICMAKDISTLLKNEQELRRAANVFKNSGEGIVITDKEGNITDVNSAYLKITDSSKTQSIGKLFFLFDTSRVSPQSKERMEHALAEKKTYKREASYVKENNRKAALRISMSAIRDAKDEVLNYIAICSDITKEKENERRLYRMARHDSLTELPNRYALYESTEQDLLALSKDELSSYALLMLDVDNFKNVNNSLGPAAGDVTIVKIAKRLMNYLSENTEADSSLYRNGGDEFVISIKNFAKVKSIEDIAQGLIHIMNSQPFKIGFHSVQLSVSVGAVLRPQSDYDTEQLVRNCELAMHKAKQLGKNRLIIFNESIIEENDRKYFLTNALKNAVKTEEFEAWFQPKVDPQSGECSSFEALARWNMSDGNRISPLEFIPAAEECGLISDIDIIILKQSCRFVEFMRSKGHSVCVAVNISAMHLKEKDFHIKIIETIETFGIDKKSIELEITESSVMTDKELCIEQIKTLRSKGLKVALDDFGTGHSSLSVLREIPLDVIKIDKSFIDKICLDKNDLTIVHMIISLGQLLELAVVAEGVEDEEQAGLLVSMGCELIQGYYYSKPLQSAEALDFITKRNVAPC